MSIVERQYSCAMCGAQLVGEIEFEVLIDDAVRRVAVHAGHSTCVVADREAVPGRETLIRAA